MHTTWFRSNFLRVFKFPKIKGGRGDLISSGHPILQNGWIITSPLLYFNLESFRDPNSSSLTRFQCILHGSGALFSVLSNFLKLKRGPNFLGITFSAEWLNYYVPTPPPPTPRFSVSIWTVLRTQILCHSLGFNAFCMVQECFCQTFETSTN